MVVRRSSPKKNASPRKNNNMILSSSQHSIAKATTITVILVGLIVQIAMLVFVTHDTRPEELVNDEPTRLLQMLDETMDYQPRPLRTNNNNNNNNSNNKNDKDDELEDLEKAASIALAATSSDTTPKISSSSLPAAAAATVTTLQTKHFSKEDENCPFRNSPMYRSIYVYPDPTNTERWTGDILSGNYDNTTWTWLQVQQKTKSRASVHYDTKKPTIQYNTELLIELLMKHPDSCLQTQNPETAKLFYVPYMPSLEYHNASNGLGDYKTSPFGKALIEAIDNQDYILWERTFGLTSRYWKRRNGSDHLLVFSEPLHGLYHPKSRRGDYHFIHTQKQLAAPIIMSVEVSTTFVKRYPNCARKNVVLPYPNTDGEWFNGIMDDEYGMYPSVSNDNNNNNNNNDTTNAMTSATLPVERQLQDDVTSTPPALRPRPYAQFYSAGNHGSCQKLRKVLAADYKCSPSHQAIQLRQRQTKGGKGGGIKYAEGYRQASFCPCPGGDSPSAKRMFDALHAGCVPLILSKDFVWPFTREFDTINNDTDGEYDGDTFLDPSLFSIRLDAKQFNHPKRNETTCTLFNSSEPDLQAYLETSISASQLDKLRRQARIASDAYSWYEKSRQLPNNPLTADILPTGGAAHRLIAAWAERAEGKLWPACREELEELKRNNNGKMPDDVKSFKC